MPDDRRKTDLFFYVLFLSASTMVRPVSARVRPGLQGNGFRSNSTDGAFYLDHFLVLSWARFFDIVSVQPVATPDGGFKSCSGYSPSDMRFHIDIVLCFLQVRR